jgi:hypothetical protein
LFDLFSSVAGGERRGAGLFSEVMVFVERALGRWDVVNL